MQKNLHYHQKNIAYRIVGNGLPVVLIHGFGEDSIIWDKQIDFLTAKCMLIVPDLPGSGNSELITEEDLLRTSVEPISINDYADIINALLITENIDSCIMLGHSMGGYITLAFAENYAEKLLKFGLVHSSALADSNEKKLTRLKGIELMDTYGAAPFLKNTIPNLFSSNFKKEHLAMVSGLIDAAQLFNTEACKQYYRAMMNRPDRTAVLKGNPKPILFVIGTEDVAAPMADVLPQTLLPVDADHYILEGVGHMGMWEATDQLNEILIDFIQP